MVAFHQATLISVIALLLYFMWMDVNLYDKIQNTCISSFQAIEPDDHTTERPHLFSPFTGLSVKMILLDQGSNYVYGPLADAFEKVSCCSSPSSLLLFP